MDYKKPLRLCAFARIFFFILLFSSTVYAQIDRVEPPFWWSGMNLSDVQIMFYGKNIAQNDVSVSNGIVIKGIQKTENPNYVFVTIDTKNITAQDFVFTFKNKNKSFTKNYSLKSRRENSRFRESYDSSDMIYLIMSDRFANGNPSNDSTAETIEKANRSNKDGRHGGDIEGIIKNLDYLKELGATAVWPTPLCEDNDERGSYHTYGQSDLYKIDSRFGTNEDYLRLSSELHKRGMKNIMDYVTNHWGYKHWMMNDLPTYDWIHQFPGFSQTNYRMTTQFDTNTSTIDAKNCMDGWFVKSMPDLNQSNPLVLNYLIQNAIWWIEFADLDGFRVDTYSYNDKEGISKWTKSITDEYPHFNIVGEVWMHNQAQMAYWQKDSKIGAIESFNSNLPSVMDFTLFDAVNGGVFNEDQSTWDKGMIKIYDNFTNDFLYPNINNILVFAENHDTNRLNETYKNDFNKYKIAMSLIATIRGIPQLYYGSEIAMAGDKGKGDGDIRRDFPGGWNGDTNNAFTNSGRTEEQKKFFDFTSKLFNWRKAKKVIHSGKMMHYIPENNVYVYFRYNEKESVMVVINNSSEKQTFKTNRFKESIKNYQSGTDVISGKTIDLKNDMELDGKSVLILELK
ncbi:glycoside hydrolase family 13 protein [Flavobacterium sp. SUN052]|uniref:glycoside hydrolase family 13 protein n=1 Tax=Flavobacterium sp. SUN052 TaxID=3002441 RepID=UPI00237DB352|nr:glycoside hydrolase family 13 protein [Flavobacterium sp. SUN052]MEC4004604.1 glycoside hydrolase family 13 protein [Flavobacterium sp. SUN052]